MVMSVAGCAVRLLVVAVVVVADLTVAVYEAPATLVFLPMAEFGRKNSALTEIDVADVAAPH